MKNGCWFAGRLRRIKQWVPINLLNTCLWIINLQFRIFKTLINEPHVMWSLCSFRLPHFLRRLMRTHHSLPLAIHGFVFLQRFYFTRVTCCFTEATISVGEMIQRIWFGLIEFNDEIIKFLKDFIIFYVSFRVSALFELSLTLSYQLLGSVSVVDFHPDFGFL